MEGTETITPQPNPWNKPATTGSSPWGKKVEVVPCSLEDVMSEQLATDLQKKEYAGIGAAGAPGPDDADPEILALINSSATDELDTSSDVALARMMQMQFDQEHNDRLRAQEKHHNKHNKVTVSLDNFKSPHPAFREDEEWESQSNQVEEEQPTAWDEEVPSFKKRGYAGKGKNITTKHDAVICGRKNASKLMDFPPEFESGDGEGMDMKLPNHVYNKLKRHSEAESKRSQKLHEKKEHSTAEQAMDPRTRLLLYKQVNNGRLESISGSISTGKESVVFHAYGGEYEGRRMTKEVAIKVFKTTLNEFKNREKYIHGDHRFSKDDYKKFNPRKIIALWAMKETANLNRVSLKPSNDRREFKNREKYIHGDHRFSKDDYKKFNPRKIIALWAMKETANLNRMKKFDVPCPQVQLLKKHVLVMSFIGENRTPAPKLKHARLNTVDAQDAYEQVIQILKKLYQECDLVHADLSEYNMLWWRDKVWIIDVSQAVDITHPFALEFLYRDCTNVTKFFNSCGVHDVKTPEKLFIAVTRLKISGEGADFLAQVQRYAKEKREELLAYQASTKEYPFDFFFEQSLKDKTILPDQVAMSDSGSDDEDH